MMFTTNNNNDANQKPIEIFGQNPPNLNTEEGGQPRPNGVDAGGPLKPIEIFGQNPPNGNTEEGGQPRPNGVDAGGPPLDITRTSNPTAFGGNDIDATAQDNQAPVNPLINQQGQGQVTFTTKPDNSDPKTNVLRFLQNPDLQNILAQRQAQQETQTQQQRLINAQSAQRRMFPQPQEILPPPAPLPFLEQPPMPSNPEFLGQPPLQPNPEFLRPPPLQLPNPEFPRPPPLQPYPELLRQPPMQSNPFLKQAPAQPNPVLEVRPPVPPFGVRFPPVMPEGPPIYPMVPQLPPPALPFYPFIFPPIQPGNIGPFGQTSDDDDRPSVKVNVETSRSKIQTSKNTKKP